MCGGRGFNILKDDDMLKFYTWNPGNEAEAGSHSMRTISRKDYKRELLGGYDMSCSSCFLDERESRCSYCNGEGYFVEFGDGD